MTYPKFIPPHGGYRKLKSFQTAEIIFDLTKEFCDRYLAGDKSNRSYRTYDQMFQAASKILQKAVRFPELQKILN